MLHLTLILSLIYLVHGCQIRGPATTCGGEDINEGNPIKVENPTTVLRLDGINATIRNNTFINLKSTDQLGIFFSTITDIEDAAFATMPKLRALSFQKCKLPRLTPDMFRGCEALRMLSLRGNDGLELDDGVFGEVKLTDLTLRNCQIKEFSYNEFIGLESSLKSLDISANPITALDVDRLLDLLPNLEILYIDSTDIPCEDLGGIVKELRSNNITIYHEFDSGFPACPDIK